MMMDMVEVPGGTANRARILPAFLFLVLLVAVAACGGDGDEKESTAGQTGGSDSAVSGGQDLETIEIGTRWATANAASLSALVASSQEVFSARVARLTGEREEVLNPARAGSAIPISIYELEITETFVGDRAPGSLATFEQAGGTSEQDGETVRLMLEGDPPVEVGKEYLFFASVKENGTLSAPPYGRLEITAEGSLMPVETWRELGAIQHLSRVPAEQVNGEIDAASQ